LQTGSDPPLLTFPQKTETKLLQSGATPDILGESPKATSKRRQQDKKDLKGLAIVQRF
jgi:hypothetical protein